MSENLGDAVLRLSVDDSQLDSQLNAAGKSAESKVKRAGKNIMKAGAGLTAGLTLPIIAFAKVAAGEMGDIEKANAQTAASIARIGANSKVSVAGVQALAGALQKKSGIDDQAIQTASNYILTLGAIDTKTKQGAKTFKDATTTAVNMAEALGMDVGAAGKQVAKSMAAASQGALLLPRGMKLSAAETEKVTAALEKAHGASAKQAVVMDVLGKKFAGAANLTNADRWAIVQDQFAGIGATLLTTLMPTFQQFTNWLQRVMDKFNALSPGVQSFIAKALLIGAVLGPVLVVVGALVTAIGAIGLPVLAAVAAIAALGVILMKSGVNMQAVKTKLLGLMAGVRTFVQVLTGSSTQARGQMSQLNQAFATAADKVKLAMTKIAQFVKPVLMEIKATLTVWGGWARSFWNKFGGDIMSAVSTAFDRISAVVGPYLNGMRAVITAVLRLLRGDFSGAWSSIKTAASSFFQSFVAMVRGLGATFLDAAKSIGKAIIDGIVAGIKAGAGAIADAAKSAAGDALKAAKNKLKIFSPSRVFFNEVGLPISQGIAMGIGAGTSGVIEQLTRQIDKATGAVQKRLQKKLAKLEQQMRARTKRLENILGSASMGQSIADLWDSKNPDNAANVRKENQQRISVAKTEQAKLQAYLKANAKKMSQQERQGIIDRIAQINNDIAGWNAEIADADKAAADELKNRADEAENLRREALGLPSLEEEAHIAALNAIRQQYGLPLLDANGNAPETPVDVTGGPPTTTTGGAGGAGSEGGGTPVVIYQTFSGEPDMYAASHRASFAYRTVGLASA